MMKAKSFLHERFPKIKIILLYAKLINRKFQFETVNAGL